VAVVAAVAAADTEPVRTALRSALLIVIVALTGCAMANAPGPQNRAFTPLGSSDGGSGGGGSGGGGMGM
jgi:hypothetical protein